MNTKVQVISLRKIIGAGSLRAFADVRIGNTLVIRGCPIYEGKNGLFASLPRQISGNGTWIETVIIIDDAFKTKCHKAILESFEHSDED